MNDKWRDTKGIPYKVVENFFGLEAGFEYWFICTVSTSCFHRLTSFSTKEIL